MNRYKVWSHTTDEEDGMYVDALDVEDAAIQFAADDQEGWAEGRYTDEHIAITADIRKDGHTVYIKTESGEIFTCRVGVSEVEPVFAAYQMKGD